MHTGRVEIPVRRRGQRELPTKRLLRTNIFSVMECNALESLLLYTEKGTPKLEIERGKILNDYITYNNIINVRTSLTFDTVQRITAIRSSQFHSETRTKNFPH